MNDWLIAARALAEAIDAVLDAAAAPVARVVISAKDGDWTPGQAGPGCDNCDQAVITPGTTIRHVSGADGPSRFAQGDVSRNSLTAVEYRIQVGVCVDEAAGSLPDGDVALDPGSPTNARTEWAEAARVTAARYALTVPLVEEWERRLCAVIPGGRHGSLVSAVHWVEGGCAGTDMRVEAYL